MNKLSKPIRESAEKVFRELCIELKEHCLTLLHSGHECGSKKVDKIILEKIMGKMINNIINFLSQRIDEVPAFLYIIDKNLNTFFAEQNFILKEYHECCIKCFAEDQEMKDF